ncbi:MAG: zinc ribbon domain-containing protein [Anaerolineae bacterium]|jgi:RNA polymerase subunit RPABC4/transcription elongation factor Spt4
MDFESILNTIQPFLIMFAALFAAFLTAVWVSVVIWTFRDIRSRSRDIFAQILATLMVLIFFPLFPFPGLILYLLLRPRETLSEVYERSLEEEALLQGIEERLACPGCNRRIEEGYMICPTCHTRLKKSCPACGRLLHLRWNICPFCGAVQTATKPSPALAAQTVTVQLEPTAESPQLSGGASSRLAETAAGSGPETEWEDWAEPAPEEAAGAESPSAGAESSSAGADSTSDGPEPPQDTESESDPQADPLPFDFD